jgi:hypothetical protein
MGTERNAQELKWAVPVSGATSWFHYKPDALYCDFPRLVIRQPSVWQSTLRPSGIHKVEGPVFIAHVEGGGFHDAAV